MLDAILGISLTDSTLALSSVKYSRTPSWQGGKSWLAVVGQRFE